VSRTNRELSAEDIGRIADTHHAWRGEDADLKRYGDVPGFPYEDVPGLCAAAGPSCVLDQRRRTPMAPPHTMQLAGRADWCSPSPRMGQPGARKRAAVRGRSYTSGP
jgi:hypothetical protein